MKPADIIIFVIFVSIQMLQSICLIYAIISASYILPRFRFIAGAVMYLVITNFINQPASKLLARYTTSFSISYAFILYNLVSLAFAALFFWAAGFLLKNRLNLE